MQKGRALSRDDITKEIKIIMPSFFGDTAKEKL